MKKVYIYPQNLKSAAKLWLWSLRDFMIIGISLLASVFLVVTTGFLGLAVASALFAFLTIRFEDTTIMDYIGYASKYFLFSQQYFTWRIDKWEEN